MYLTSFIHRNALFTIAERWFCNCLEPDDGRSLTKILICDGFVINETLAVLTRRLLDMTNRSPFIERRINSKGELRDMICRDEQEATQRVAELLNKYRDNPDYYYREAPINAMVTLDKKNHLTGSFRIKRPKRIAEKAHRKIADWIYAVILARAEEAARERARRSRISMEELITSGAEMLDEFIEAEEVIAGRFRDSSIRFDRAALTIDDVGAIKIVGNNEELEKLEQDVMRCPDMTIIKRETFSGKYQATKLILEVPWDAAYACRRYCECQAWERYLNRGIPEGDLRKGLEIFLEDTEPRINIEVILTTFSDLVESELGSSIHEERIITQRDNKRYKGNIPLNVEFIVESMFALGFSPRIDIDEAPIKLWGRYLPETLSSYVRRLYNMPEYDLIY